MADLLGVFGEPLLRYLLAYDLPDFDLAEFSAEQTEVSGALQQFATPAAEEHLYARTVGLGNALGQYFEDKQTTLANICRLECHGLLPDLPGTFDRVLELLLSLGRDLYAGLLLPAADDEIDAAWPLGGPIFRHPLHIRFCQAVLADDGLQRLFPGAGPGLDLADMATLASVQSTLMFSSGRAGGFQLATLAEHLLVAAYYRGLLDGPLSPENYLQSLEAVLGDVRRLASGQPCPVPTIFGFGNIELPPGAAATMPTGELRSAFSISNKLVPKGVSLSAALVTTAPLQLLQIEPFTPTEPGQNPFAKLSKFRSEIAQSQAAVYRSAELLRLAFLLASPPEGLYAVRHVCRTTLDPLQLRPAMQWGIDSPFSPSPITGLGNEALNKVQEWANRTKDHPQRLDIAMRRTLSAAVERTDPHDGFIDAVLAWENMFSGRPETNLRVCGAIAWLLEPDNYQRRTALFSELKDLYTKRSNLVHGAIQTVDDVVACWDRAVRIAVESMKRLYDDLDLLRIKDSAERGGLILMGRAQPADTAAESGGPAPV